jgi:hypothetical protein
MLFGVQVVQFMTNVASLDPQRFPYKLNSLLPHDIRVYWMSQTAPDFSVTASANHKVGSGGYGGRERGGPWGGCVGEVELGSQLEGLSCGLGFECASWHCVASA